MAKSFTLKNSLKVNSDMKRYIYTMTLLTFIVLKTYSQSPPEAINYSSVIRGNSGQALPNKLVAFRFSILVGSSSGTVVYQETQSKTTDQWGAVSLAIGLGNVTKGSFATIDWAAGEHYLKIDLDDNGGSNFQTMGTVQFLSVPYALHSKTAESVTNYSETDPTFNVSVAKGITEADTIRWNSASSSQWGYLSGNLFYNSGKVGIGTSNPASPLSLEVTSINSSPNRTIFSLHNKSTDGGSLSQIKLTAGNSGSQTMINHSSSTYQGVPNTADYGSIVTTGAGFYLHAGGSGNLRFMTNGDGTQGFERMRITNDGKVGIGTLTPSSPLSVNGVIESLNGGIKFPDGSIQSTASSNSLWQSLPTDPNSRGIKYSDGLTGNYEFSSIGSATGVPVGLTIKNSKSTFSSWSYLDLSTSSTTSPTSNRSYITLGSPFGKFSIEARDSTLTLLGSKSQFSMSEKAFGLQLTHGESFLQISEKGGFNYGNGVQQFNIGKEGRISVGAPTTTDNRLNIRGSLWLDGILKIDDDDNTANNLLGIYENDTNMPILYSRFFYGQYRDLVIQGSSKTYTGNIHFVTGSTVAGADAPTQRMVVMGNGNVGIGNFVSSAPTAKLQIKSGDVYLENIGSGVIMKSPNGQCWRVTIDNSGNLVRTSITCP